MGHRWGGVGRRWRGWDIGGLCGAVWVQHVLSCQSSPTTLQSQYGFGVGQRWAIYGSMGEASMSEASMGEVSRGEASSGEVRRGKASMSQASMGEASIV